MKDARSILLLVLSTCLLATWVYHIYDKSKYAALPEKVQEQITPEVTKKMSDSLGKLYQTTISQLETVIVGKDSLNRELQQKADEINVLKSEILYMLNEQTITKDDLRKALQKIQDLQVKVNQYNLKSSERGIVGQVTEPQTTGANTITPSKSKSPAVSETVFQASQVLLVPVSNNNGSQINISFQLKAIGQAQGNTMIHLVLKDPAGATVQDDEWIAGVFESKQEGNIRYSRNLKWDYNKNDSRQFNATIPVNRLNEGVYQLKIYCNGKRISGAEVAVKD
jgi:hypothetical protein